MRGGHKLEPGITALSLGGEGMARIPLNFAFYSPRMRVDSNQTCLWRIR